MSNYSEAQKKKVRHANSKDVSDIHAGRLRYVLSQAEWQPAFGQPTWMQVNVKDAFSTYDLVRYLVPIYGYRPDLQHKQTYHMIFEHFHYWIDGDLLYREASIDFGNRQRKQTLKVKNAPPPPTQGELF